ncbi:MAG: hypothetical protein JWR61_3029 [Ferruginibacter sp.]|nr:hypothetical protein [Ferruginibacter sp.]
MHHCTNLTNRRAAWSIAEMRKHTFATSTVKLPAVWQIFWLTPLVGSANF